MKNINFQEKIIQFITRINEKNPYYVIGGFLVLVLLLDYFLIMQFQARTLSALNVRMSKMQADITKSREDIERFSAYQNQLKRLQDRFEKVKNKIRTKDDLPLILENISRIANNNGMRLEQMMPNTSLISTVLKDNDGEYVAIPILVEARSEYHSFGRFLSRLENEEVFLTVPEFVIRSNPQDQTRHNIQLTINAVVFEKK